MNWHERWSKVDEKLKQLDYEDQQKEPELLEVAYENLLCAYQQARELNMEMEGLLQEYMQNC